MRPLKLTVEGFTSFCDRQDIDFTQLELFAITGPTGAGKSSILDAMTYALYGRVARMESKLQAQAEQLIRQGMQNLKVQLEFEVNKQRYQITRTWYRPGKSSPKRQCLLDCWNPTKEEWQRRDDLEIEALLKMDFETFTKVILLPQGAFDRFLKGSGTVRRAILREIAGLEIFEQMRKEAGQREKIHQNTVKMRQQDLAGLAIAPPEDVQAKTNQLDQVKRDISNLEPQERSLDLELQGAQKRLEQLAKLTQTQAKIDELEAQTDTIKALELRLQQAKIADRLQPLWQALDQTQQQQGAARKQYDAALTQQQTWQERHRSNEATKTQLEEHRLKVEAELERRAHRLDTIETQQIELDGFQKTLNEAEAATTQAQTAADTATASVQTIQVQIKQCQLKQTKLTTQIASLARDPARLACLAQVLPQLALWQKAQEHVALAQQTHQELEHKYKTKQAAQVAAQATHDQDQTSLGQAQTAAEAAQTQLNQATQANHVVALQAHLHAGENCPVCGGLVPEVLPSCTANEPNLDALRQTLKQAQNAYDNAVTTAQTAHTTLATLTTECNGLAEQLQAAQQQVMTTTAQANQAQQAISAQLEATAWTVTEIQQEHQQLQEADAAYADLSTQLKDCEHDLSSQNQALAYAQKEAERLTIALSEAQSQAQTAQAKVTDQTTELNTLLAGQTVEELEGALRRDRNKWQQKVERVATDYQNSKDQLTQARTRCEERSQTLDTARQAQTEATTAWQTALADRNFTPEQFQQAQAKEAQQQAWDKQIQDHKTQLNNQRNHAQILQTELDDRDSDPQDTATVEQMQQQLQDLQQALKAARQQQQELEGWLREHNSKKDRAQALQTELKQAEHQVQIHHQLAQDLKSDKFQAFLLESWERELVARANQILRDLSQERYNLRLSSKGDYQVIDCWNARATRSVKTLSGGETFAASLSMALALSDKLAQNAELGSLFLDEGFGTLDQESLDSVCQILESLRQRDRLIGVITHIGSLAERLPTRLVVEKRETGSTVKVMG